MAVATSPIAVIYSELADFLATILGSKNNIFHGNRPNATDDAMNQFVVTSLPAELEDIIIGNKDTSLKTTGIFYCFYKAKKNTTLNINGLSELTYSIKRAFPYTGEHIIISKPKVLHEGYDENGFHVASIVFNLRTKTNAFSE